MVSGTIHLGIRIDFIGDSGPFSRTGKSIGYRLTVKDAPYLIDLGGPVFQHIGHDGIRAMKGVFATHSHEDHRRWFTDIALFMYYSDIRRPLRLIATEVIHEEWEKNAKAALERSLSPDQKRVIEVPYNAFVEKVAFGPRAKYHISPVQIPSYPEGFVWRVLDRHHQVVDPALAKVIVHHSNRPRLLFKDPVLHEWVEPEVFYPLADERFYEAEQNPFYDAEAGLTVRPVKSVAWHGPPTYGMEFTTANERLLFTSDTVYDPDLWQALAHERHTQKLPTTQREFETHYLVRGDINDLIQRTWSVERLNEALDMYHGGLVIQDVDYNGSVVHTSYDILRQAGFTNQLLTHSPDDFVSEMPLARERKTFRLLRDQLYEEAGGKLYPYQADLFVKRQSWFFVGFRNPQGATPTFRSNDRLHVALPGEPVEGEVTGTYDLYADIDGRYYPLLADANSRYYRRPDGGLDRVTFTSEGSTGIAMKNMRDDLVPPLEEPQ